MERLGGWGRHTLGPSPLNPLLDFSGYGESKFSGYISVLDSTAAIIYINKPWICVNLMDAPGLGWSSDS